MIDKQLLQEAVDDLTNNLAELLTDWYDRHAGVMLALGSPGDTPQVVMREVAKILRDRAAGYEQVADNLDKATDIVEEAEYEGRSLDDEGEGGGGSGMIGGAMFGAP